MMMLASPLVETVFGYGSFRGNVTETALALGAYSVGLWAVSTQSILVRTFLAKKHTAAPALISVATIFLSVFLAVAWMGPPQVRPDTGLARFTAALQQRCELLQLGHVGIALANSVSAYVSVFLLLLLLPRFGTRISIFALLASIGRTAAATGAMAAVLFLLLKLQFGSIATVCLAVPLGAAVFGATAYLIRSPELREVLTSAAAVGRRLRR